MKRWVSLAGGLCGLALVGWLVWDAGPATVAGTLDRLGWGIGLVMVPQILVSVLDGAGWRYAFPGTTPRLAPLVAGRLAGEAVNATTPTATMGGEPVKAWLVTRLGVPLDEGIASVLIAKTALVVSQLAFLVLGLGLGVWWRQLGPGLLLLMVGLTAYAVVSVGILIWAQARGLLGAGRRILAWLGVAAGDRLVRLDAHLRGFYRGRRDRLGLTLLFHLLGWLAGVIEVWWGLALLGQPVDLPTAVVIEAFVSGVRSASFVIPASLGAQEGGLVAISLACGLPGETGLTFGLIRRLREAVWAAAGYAVVVAWEHVT